MFFALAPRARFPHNLRHHLLLLKKKSKLCARAHSNARRGFADAYLYSVNGSVLESVKTDFNDWIGTKIKNTAIGVRATDTGKVSVSGTTQPNWWVRVEFPKSGNLPVERQDVQADANGNYVLTSNNEHLAGPVNIMSVKYNFVDNAKQISDSGLLSAQVGAWYWRFARNIDSNIESTYFQFLAKINSGEAITSSQGVSRRAHFVRAQTVMELPNTYGNVREILGGLGLRTSVRDGYNTQYGVTLNKRTPTHIGNANLLSDDSVPADDATSRNQLGKALQSDFEIQLGELDMAFIALPDAVPVSLAEVVPMVAKNPSTSNVPTDGICVFHQATTALVSFGI